MISPPTGDRQRATIAAYPAIWSRASRSRGARQRTTRRHARGREAILALDGCADGGIRLGVALMCTLFGMRRPNTLELRTGPSEDGQGPAVAAGRVGSRRPIGDDGGGYRGLLESCSTHPGLWDTGYKARKLMKPRWKRHRAMTELRASVRPFERRDHLFRMTFVAAQ
jgi:hypothetical protein